MKKVLALLLVLVTLLSLASPAMAYTKNAATYGSDAYKVSLRLVDYDVGYDALSGWLRSPASDRGYARNEIVAAIGSITIPGNYVPSAEYYTQLRFTGKNVTFNVTDNKPGGSYQLMNTLPVSSWKTNEWTLENDGKRLRIALDNNNDFPVSSSSKTYEFLVFAKVTKEGASISFEMARDLDFGGITGAWTTSSPFGSGSSRAVSYLVLNRKYVVVKQSSGNYMVFSHTESTPYAGNAAPKGDLLFRIELGKRNKTERLYMYTRGASGPQYRVHVEPSVKELIFIVVGNTVTKYKDGDQIKIGNSSYKALKSFYDQHFEKGLGFTAYNEGNIMKEQDWIDLAATKSASATVELRPYSDYVRR